MLEVVTDLTQTVVTAEAENATYVTEQMIVVNMIGVERAADRTDAALLAQKHLKLLAEA
nr:hypothetical protein [Planosporangium mesophilum]